MSESNNLGDIGEAAVTLEALKRGYYVGHMQQDCPYDLVIDRRRGKGPERVQVKYRSLVQDENNYRRHNTIQLVFRPARHNQRRTYTSTDIDAFALYVPQLNQVFWIPSSVCDTGRREMILRTTERSKNNLYLFADW